jgi:hypothetical protein
MKYRVLETVACWVTFEQLIEASSPEDAEAQLRSGDYTPLIVPALEPVIGDAIDGYDTIVEATLEDAE